MSLEDSAGSWAMDEDEVDMQMDDPDLLDVDDAGDDADFGLDAADMLDDKEWTILSRERLCEAQQKDMEKVIEVLGVTAGWARVLLMHFQWDTERLLEMFFDKGREQVFKSAGVKEPDEQKHKQGTTTCPLCFDDQPFDDTMALNCGHRFCNSCWTTYISMKINEGMATAIHCPAHPKCNVRVDEALIPNYVDAKTHAKYTEKLVESYVEDNPRIKWCPSTPFCGNAARVKEGSGTTIDIKCSCGYRFCFHCATEAHAPCSCQMRQLWAKKCADDSETVNYLTAFTKPCPKCGKHVEKDGGCNLVTCRCGQHFCWLCGGATGAAHTWTSIEGHSCGKYAENNKDMETARDNIKRFAHFYERFKASDDIKKIKEKLQKDVRQKVEDLHEVISMYELRWYEKALEQLFECRRILAYSYVFAYYMFGEDMKFHEVLNNKLHKTLFEDHQEQLEVCTEKLNKMLVMPKQDVSPHMVQDMMNLTGIADRRCKALFDIIITDILATGDYGFQISRYHPNIEGNKGRTAAESRLDRKGPPMVHSPPAPQGKKPKLQEEKKEENKKKKKPEPKVEDKKKKKPEEKKKVEEKKKPAVVKKASSHIFFTSSTRPAKELTLVKDEPKVEEKKKKPVEEKKPAPFAFQAPPAVLAVPKLAPKGPRAPPAAKPAEEVLSEEEMMARAIQASLQEHLPPAAMEEEEAMKKALELSLQEFQAQRTS